MKKLAILIFCSVLFHTTYAQVGVGTTTPDANAQLDIVSSTKGLFIPRLDATEVSTLAGNLDATDDGLLIYNTTEQCIQVWKWDASIPAGEFSCLAIVTGGALGNAGVVKVNFNGTVAGAITAREAAVTWGTGGIPGKITARTHPGFMEWTTGGSPVPPAYANTVFGPFDQVAANLSLSLPPTTDWPENEANKTLTGGIWTDEKTFVGGTAETNDAWRENDIPGQVHIWRITIFGYPGSSGGGELEMRFRNPQSGFVSGYAQLVPSASGLYSQTFTITTIADNQSLPSGGGNGYVIEIRSNSGAQEIWIDSVTRISLYNE